MGWFMEVIFFLSSIQLNIKLTPLNSLIIWVVQSYELNLDGNQKSDKLISCTPEVEESEHLCFSCMDTAYVRGDPPRKSPYKVQYLHFRYLKVLGIYLPVAKQRGSWGISEFGLMKGRWCFVNKYFPYWGFVSGGSVKEMGCFSAAMTDTGDVRHKISRNPA